jgi:transcriptional regulator with XRE-family HTH domain
MNIQIQFGKKVSLLRKERNLSQEALANLAGLDRTYIPSIEKGERNISIVVIQKIAKAFEMEMSVLLKDIK